MTVIVPIRSDNAYVGVAKETTPGTPVAPSIFPRWMDGTSIEIDLATEDVKEGDGSRRLSTIIKNRQSVKIKLTATLRPNELGFFETAAMGASSDTYTAATVNTTMSSASVVGATTISVAANTGLTGTGSISLALGAGGTSEEIATFNLPATGAGPYTLTVASSYNGGALKLAHANSSTVQSSSSHVIADQSDGNYYTIEVGLGSLFSAGGTTLRVRTCKVVSFKRHGKAGGLLMHEIEFFGIATAYQATPATITLEQHQPFLYTQGTWTIDGSSSSNDAISIDEFHIEQKNNVDTSIQTEQLTNAASIFGMLDVEVGYSLVFTGASKIYQTYFGSTTGTADAQALGLGSFSVVFTQPDGLQSVTYTIPTVGYVKLGLPSPKKDGKHYKMSVSGKGIAAPLSGAGSNNAYILQTTLTNLQASAY